MACLVVIYYDICVGKYASNLPLADLINSFNLQVSILTFESQLSCAYL